MNIEHLGAQPLEYDPSTAGELPRHAQLYTLRSEEIVGQEKGDLRDIGLTFLNQLGDKSFRMRFGIPKPYATRLGRLVDHFLEGRTHPHVMLLLLHEQRLLGAASVFRHQLRASAFGEIIDTIHVAELSVTIADELQGQGLGKLLLSQARQFAIDAAFTHVYFSFEPANHASRRMVESVCGVDQLVAGASNPRDKYFRITPHDPELDLIEQTMRVYCDDTSESSLQSTETAQKYPRLSTTKFGRRVLEALESIEIMLPEGLRL